jgi:RNA polymerase sigma-70 factor (ECF subfamily)
MGRTRGEGIMDQSSMLRTSASLLTRLRNPDIDQRAWNEFVRCYEPLIRRWCLRWRLQEADAGDIAQAVLAKLVVKLREFEYDPTRSFRAYLKTLTGYAWRDFVDAHRKAGAGTGDSMCWELLQGVEARDDLLRRLDQEFDRELLDAASIRVRERVEPHTWEAFRLTALEGMSGADAAVQLGMKVFTVFKAKNKVQKMLQEEVARLEADPGAE